MKPRLGSSKGVVNILFCKDGPLKSSVTFTPNHFVPLVPISRISKKRKSCSNDVPVTIKKKQLSFIETNNPEKSCQSKLSDFFSSSKSTFEIEVNSVPNISVDKPIINLNRVYFSICRYLLLFNFNTSYQYHWVRCLYIFWESC